MRSEMLKNEDILKPGAVLTARKLTAEEIVEIKRQQIEMEKQEELREFWYRENLPRMLAMVITI